MTPLQKAIFDLICEIDDICRENNITYYLHAGSVIGAVRHHSIIPWDDDMDIAITRSNWEKLKPLLKNVSIENRALVTPEEYDDYLFTYPQYKNTSTAILVKSGAFYSFPIGVIVDIIIMDPVKDNGRSIERHKENLKLLSELRCRRFVLNRDTNWFRYRIYKIIESIFGHDYILNYLQRRLERVDEKDCDGYIQRVGIYPVFWDKKYFAEPEYVEIEGRNFPVPSHTEEYLRYTYGDSWIKYPPLSDRKLTHSFEYNLDYSFQDIQNDFSSFIDVERYRHEWERYKYWRAKAVTSENNVRISNSKYMAEINACAINEFFNSINLEFEFIQNQYRKLYDWFDKYLNLQLSKRYIKDGIPVPVRDEVFYFACMVLVLRGEYEKADQIFQVNKSVKRDKNICLKIERAIEASRKLSIAIYDDKWDWEEIKILIESELPKYPHHVDFIYAKCASLLHTKGKECAERVISICKEELVYHPDCDVLLKCLADSKKLMGYEAEAAYLYHEIYSNTDNGMLHLELEDLIESKETSVVEELLEDEAQKTYETKQTKKLCEVSNLLLAELDEICDRENIPYFLGGSLAAAALGKLENTEIPSYYIIMHPADRQNLIDAVNKHLKKGRALESLENSRNYPDFSIRYCDTTTIDFDLRSKGFYYYNGINITIYFVRPIAKTNLTRTLKRMLYTTVEALAYPSPFNYLPKRKIIAGCLGRVVAFFLTKKNIKKIALKILFLQNLDKYKIKGRIKDFWTQSMKLPTLNFSKCKYCSWDNNKYPIPINYDKYIDVQLSQAKKSIIKKTMIGLPHVVEINAPCEKIIRRLTGLKIKCKYFRANRKLGKYNRRFRIETSYVNYAWKIMLRSADRFKMYKKYAPLKEKILSYYDKKEFSKLEGLLSDYLEAIEENDKRGLALSFDIEIFAVACDVLEMQGKRGLVIRLKKRVPKEHLKQIPYLCGRISNMQKAKYKDKRRILNYLEEDVENCLYMYADISKYGVEGKNVTVWYDMDDIGIRMVVMKYHNNFQIYSNRGFKELESVISLINYQRPQGVFGRKEIITNLVNPLNEQYEAEFGFVFRGKTLDVNKLDRKLKESNTDIVMAKESDVYKIAQLLCLDKDVKAIHTEQSLAKELKDRMRTKMGRSYIIRKGNEVIAHNATYAECDKFVVVSGLMVHPDFRNTEYAYLLDLKSSMEFQKEGKNRYFFVTNDRVIHWHKTIKTPIAGEYGKLLFKSKGR